MRRFLDTTFRPDELDILYHVLEEWRVQHRVQKGNPDLEIAAAVILNLFREGKRTVYALQAALLNHRGLKELTSGRPFTIKVAVPGAP